MLYEVVYFSLCSVGGLFEAYSEVAFVLDAYCVIVYQQRTVSSLRSRFFRLSELVYVVENGQAIFEG